ncbi:interleukin 12 receptor, beta 2a, like [Menidia menidia]
MATPMTRWLIPVLVYTLSLRCSATDHLSPPSRPECHIPCDDNLCSVIECTWNPRPDPKSPINYCLYWGPTNSEDGNTTWGTSSDGIIRRQDFNSHEDLRVWVQACDQHDCVKSQEVVFNTEYIIKAPPPTFSSSSQDPLEIYWSTICDKLHLTAGTCEVRYRTEEYQEWFGNKDILSGSFAVLNPQPGTIYEFQVRCACGFSLESNWSVSLRIKTAESAPVGEVDIWRDCSSSQSGYDCFLTWKELSLSQARGLILGYVVTIFYNNGTMRMVNVSAVEPRSLLVFDETMWRLTYSLMDVSSVSVSAYNALGSTDASHLALPAPGKKGNNLKLHLEMQEENLTVSWVRPSPLSASLKQYVVEYKACPSGQGFDWIKVDKSQTTVFLKGTFKKYTSYQVSLFALSENNEVHRLSTSVGYSVQGVPSVVPSFKVLSVAAKEATLIWEPVPCSKQNGVILYYQIGVDLQKVYNISVTPEMGDNTFKLPDLNPDQNYEVWIRAVTAAGPGANVTTRIKTMHQQQFGRFAPVLVVSALIVILLIVKSVCKAESKVRSLLPQCLFVKVPDPSNSHIFKQMKHQMNEPMAGICSSVLEPHPKISLLEVVETKSKVFEPNGQTRLLMQDECSWMDGQEDQTADHAAENDRTDQRYGRKDYSKMVDSDEERVDCWSSSEEEQSTWGYEKHFMPTPLEILAD